MEKTKEEETMNPQTITYSTIYKPHLQTQTCTHTRTHDKPAVLWTAPPEDVYASLLNVDSSCHLSFLALAP